MKAGAERLTPLAAAVTVALAAANRAAASAPERGSVVMYGMLAGPDSVGS